MYRAKKIKNCRFILIQPVCCYIAVKDHRHVIKIQSIMILKTENVSLSEIIYDIYLRSYRHKIYTLATHEFIKTHEIKQI